MNKNLTLYIQMNVAVGIISILFAVLFLFASKGNLYLLMSVLLSSLIIGLVTAIVWLPIYLQLNKYISGKKCYFLSAAICAFLPPLISGFFTPFSSFSLIIVTLPLSQIAALFLMLIRQ